MPQIGDGMKKRASFLVILSFVAILIISSVVVMNVVGPDTSVDYTLNITDPQGDSEGTLITDEATEQNADILKITSAKSGDNIVLTMKVAGSINTTDITTYSNGYQFNIDINGDKAYDWLVTSSYMTNYGGTDSQIQDDEGNFENLHYLENSTGQGTDTVTVKFLLSFITDFENITTWDMYATYSSVKTSTFASYVDTAPDDGFVGGGSDPTGDDDGDGMTNGWETENGLDPNDPSDASDDDDGDGYSNKEEYNAETDPQDPEDHPTEPVTKLEVKIIKPTAGEVIPPGGLEDYYRIEGTSTVPAGDYIDIMDFRVKEALVNDWEPCYDDSGDGDYSKWYGEISTYTVEGTAAHMKKGENTLEVRAITGNGLETTTTVKFNFNPDGEPPPPPPPPPPENGPRLGPFVSSDDKPIDDATVKVSPAWSAETDKDGYATFSEFLPIGTYACTVEMDGKTIFGSFNITVAKDGKVTYDGSATPPKSKLDLDEIEGEDDDDKEGSPGFEALLLFAAVAAAVSLVATRRRKRFY